ncbi:MAG: hypothetical protein LBU82_04890 [Treponema sp.]|jgi:hypothetical protein|nr:hypothetical protein [Treponema sp.]
MIREKEINGVLFSVAPFQVVEALKLQPFLLKKIGPSVGQLLDLLKDGLPESGNFGDIKIDGQALSLAIEKLTDQLGEDEFLNLIKRLFRNVTARVIKDGQEHTLSFVENQFNFSMETVFTGKVFSVYPVMFFVLEVNYPDFLAVMVQSIGPRISKITTSETGAPASTEEQET